LQQRVVAADLVRLLSVKHSKELFVAECKDGPTWTANHMRLDAWAMKRSWAQWKTWGYECKVSRSDFLGDDKWPGYLPMCHELSFVCPSGLIQAEELPEGVGLLWASKNAKRLYTKRKASYREIEPPVNLLIYILMCRASIGGEFGTSRERDIEWWKDWLAGRKDDNELGYKVSEAIAVKMKDMAKRTLSAERAVEDANVVKKLIEDTFGIDVHKLATTWSKDEMLAKAVACVPEGLVRDLRYHATQMGKTADRLEQLVGDKED